MILVTVSSCRVLQEDSSLILVACYRVILMLLVGRNSGRRDLNLIAFHLKHSVSKFIGVGHQLIVYGNWA
jgi:hypothetical protein